MSSALLTHSQLSLPSRTKTRIKFNSSFRDCIAFVNIRMGNLEQLFQQNYALRRELKTLHNQKNKKMIIKVNRWPFGAFSCISVPKETVQLDKGNDSINTQKQKTTTKQMVKRL